MIPISDIGQSDLISVLNAQELRFAFSQKKDITPPFVKAFRPGLLYTSILSILYGIFIYLVYLYLDIQSNKTIAKEKTFYEENEKKIAVANENLETSKKQYDKEQADANERIKKLEVIHQEQEKNIQRYRLILLARISDYEKELAFWRDTIRKIIYSAGGNKNQANEMINQITKVLETYHVQEKTVDFQAVMTIAELLTNKDTGEKSIEE